ncbi:MAG: 50S ribosomal protein L15 [Deltaproteobacteria bacterium]|nr:MAG: 50S ribosomal protein L15 [Deltaproteobacteria bacterium]
MVDLASLPADSGAAKNRKRVGRGIGSGYHKTAGRGHKGQKSRSGGGIHPWFEGGQMPLQRRIPKRGFTNIFRKEFAIVNVHQLNCFEDGAVVDAAALTEMGLVSQGIDRIKVLGNGLLNKKLTVKVTALSATAKEKISQAGGQVEEEAKVA